MSNPMRREIERRGHPRLPLDLTCYLHSRGLKHWKITGRTVNISRSGVLIRLETTAVTQLPPPPGSHLCVDIELPTGRVLRCHGRLVRMTECRSDGTVLAAAIERMEFRQQAGKPVAAVHQARRREVEGLLM